MPITTLYFLALAQYIIRSPFSLEKMRLIDPGDIVYRSGINPKIKRNFEVFSPAVSPRKNGGS
ncbi:MAG: hypothetical protein P9M08_12665 [Candidatus Erginobacter occultus]|nr:hypothetical protein [Candidatus Erginobacter occultus]